MQLANVESIDVLKGPAAILYGQVEPGGIVNVVTKQPQATPAYSAEAQVGSYAFYRALADATGPLTSDGKLLYRLIGSWENAGSPVDLIYNHTNFVAPSLAWLPTSRDKLTIEAEYRFMDEGQNYGYQLGYGATPTPVLGNIATNYGERSPLHEHGRVFPMQRLVAGLAEIPVVRQPQREMLLVIGLSQPARHAIPICRMACRFRAALASAASRTMSSTMTTRYRAMSILSAISAPGRSRIHC